MSQILARPDNQKTFKFVNWIIRHPLFAMAIGFVVVFALASGAKHLKANFTHTAFFNDDDQLMVDLNKFERQFGNDDALVIVVHSPSGVFNVETATLLQEMTEKMWQVPDVIRVDSLANFSWVHALEDDIEVEPLLPDEEPLTQDILDARKMVSLKHETLPNYLVSEDAKTTVVYAKIKPGFETPANAQVIVAAAKEAVAQLNKGDHEFHFTGGPIINDSFREASQTDMEKLVPVVLLMAVFFLIALLRTIGGTLLPLLVIGVSVMSALGAAGWLGLELSSVTMVLPQVLIGVAVADSVHILSSFYRARRSGLDKPAAVAHTLHKNFIPTILTSLSTAVGFFAFSTSGLKPILGLGILAGIGTLIAWLSTYLIMGALLVLLPSWVKKKKATSNVKEASPFIKSYVEKIYKIRWLVIGFYVVLCSGALFLALSNTVNSDPYKYFAKDFPMRKAQDFILENLEGVVGFELSIDSGKEEGIKDPEFLKRVESFELELKNIDGVTKTVSVLDIFKQTNRSLHGDDQAYYKLPESKDLVAQEFFLYTMSLPQGMDVNDQVTVKNDAMRMRLISEITDSSTWTRTAEQIMKMGKNHNLDVKVTGKTRLYQSMNGYVTRSFVISLLLAIVLVALILIVAFRSVKIGLLSMIPNLIPLIFGGAMLKILGHSLDIGTVLVFSVCLGIAVDDTIHVLSNFRNYTREGLSEKEAIALVLTHTGPALVVTTMVLIGAFGTLAFATFLPNVYFGIMTAVVLLSALVTDVTCLPAMLMAKDKNQG